MSTIPKNHPRYLSLITRERLAQGVQQGIVHETGLIAHGRGEAYDYLLGEMTIGPAEMAEKIAAATLICASNPVISVNGNVAMLVPQEIVQLAQAAGAKLEINLFHRTEERIKKIHQQLKQHGATMVYGTTAIATIPGLSHDRACCDEDGIFSADVTLIPLEDGDRCEALVAMGKKVIAIDLNPLSRTSRNAHITIVDNILRAIPTIERFIHQFKTMDKNNLNKMIDEWDNRKNIQMVLRYISKRINALS